MTDIFDEVAEDLRRERATHAWKRLAPYVIGAAVLIVAVVGGHRAYEYYEAQKAAESGDRFAAAITLLDDGKRAEGLAALEGIGSDAPVGYATLARLRLAAETSQQDPDKGVAAFTALANDSAMSRTLRDLASLRAGLIEFGQGKVDDARKRVEPLADPANPWRHQAREALAFAALKANDAADAKKWTDVALADQQIPPGVRSRLQVVVSLLAGQASAAN